MSDHFNGKTFFNPWTDEQNPGFAEVLRWKFTSRPKRWPRSVANPEVPQIPPAFETGNVTVTFINHATFLIQMGGLNILTDPVFSERVSPVSFAGPKRVRRPGIALEKLPPIHVVLISHNHYDHLDIDTLDFLSKRDAPQFFVALGDKKLLVGSGIKTALEMDWWNTITLSPEVKVHFAPSQHWSSRSPFDRNRSLWGAYALEYRGQCIYFAGDTGYGRHFLMSAERLPKIRLALLPIGAYEPRWFMRYAHMNPEDAVKAFHDLKADYAIAMHFGTWQLTDEGIDDPPEELAKLTAQDPGLQERFIVPVQGGAYKVGF